MFEIPRGEAVDIDEELDFEIAEMLYKKQGQRDCGPTRPEDFNS
jgi:CMP-N-acetylneuraminic acid synthetase